MSSDSEYKQVTSIKPLSSYSKETKDALDRVVIRRNDPRSVYGPYSYRITRFPSNIDIIEYFQGNSDVESKEELLDEFATYLRGTLTNVSGGDNFVYELKMWEDPKYKVNIGTLVNGVFKMKKQFVEHATDRMQKQKLLKPKEIKILRYLVDKRMKELTPLDYDILDNIFKNKREIKWSRKDLSEGYKKIRNGVKLKFKEAVENPGKVKLTTISFVDGKFITLTNTIVIVYVDEEGNKKVINDRQELLPENKNFINHILHELSLDAEKTLFSRYYFNPYESVMKQWTIANITKDKEAIERLLPLVRGDLASLFAIKNDIDTLIKLYQVASIATAKKKVIQELEEIKERLSRIIEVDETTDNMINDLIDEVEESKGKENKTLLLGQLAYGITTMLNQLTMEELQRRNLYPPIRRLMPDILRYIPEYASKNIPRRNQRAIMQ